MQTFKLNFGGNSGWLMARVYGQYAQHSIPCPATIQESRILATLRDTLLPKLLSGELRVPLNKSNKEEVYA